MKILIILTGGLKYDGITLGNIGYIKAMNKENMTFDFIATNKVDKSIIKEIKEAGANIIELGCRNKNIIKYFSYLLWKIKKSKYDVVHVHGSSSLMAIELLAAKLGGCKIRIAHSRNTMCNHMILHKALLPIFNRLSTDYFACGTEAGKWLFKNKKFTIIHNAKDIKKYKFSKEKREEIREKYKINNKLAICHIGSFNNQKNHEFLIEIFYELKKIKSDICLFLIGEGELKHNIEEKVKKLGISNEVIFTGKLSNINDIIQGMDIMVMPSKFEGLPNVVIESQIAGLKSIISDSITKECKITNLVEFESLNNSSKIWARRIIELEVEDRNKNREKVLSDIRKAGYDIVENAKKLRNIYFELKELRG